MRCPFCANEETQVKDSRVYDNGGAIKRRRYCPNCDSRFTTIEKVLYKDITVIKKDGNKTSFDKDKVISSIRIASGKKLENATIEFIVNDIMRRLESSGKNEIKTSRIAEMIMDKLERIDKAAFIRYASVYMKFEGPEDFDKFIKKVAN
jgi:transcriptional repressor NrdR